MTYLDRLLDLIHSIRFHLFRKRTLTKVIRALKEMPESKKQEIKKLLDI